MSPSRSNDPILQKKYRPLTPAEEMRVDSALKQSNSTVVSTAYKISVKVSDLKCLRPGVWLNDEVMNFYMGVLQDRCNANLNNPDFPQPNKIKALFMNTFFFQKLHNGGKYSYKSVRRWTKKSKVRSKSGQTNIFEVDKVLF